MTQMNEEKIPPDGPVLTIDREGSVRAMIIKGGRSTCNRRAFRRRYYDDIDVYDKDGRWYKIRTARLVESSIWRKVAFLLFGARRVVDLDIEFQRRAGHEEIVKAVTDGLRKDEEFWSAGGDVDEMIEEMRAAKDVDGLLSVLNYFAKY